MARTGKRPISIPEKVTVDVADRTVAVKGPHGELSRVLLPIVQVAVTSDGVVVTVPNMKDKKEVAALGTMVSLIRNMIQGVTEGYKTKLEINGVGYGWILSGKKLTVKAGYSHPVVRELPEGVTGSVEDAVLTLQGIDKQLVGETAAQIRKIRKPEPYKGKGIKYSDEQIRRKAGKQAAGASA